MLHEKLADDLAGPLQPFLPQPWVTETLDQLGHRFRTVAFPTWVMVWAFIGQVLDPDQSCNRAMARIQAHRIRLGLAPLATENLIRSVTGEAAVAKKVSPRRISFKGTIQQVLSLRDWFIGDRAIRMDSRWSRLLNLVAGQKIPYRPNRFEPRVKKRRPKNYSLMTRPRAQLKAGIGA